MPSATVINRIWNVGFREIQVLKLIQLGCNGVSLLVQSALFLLAGCSICYTLLYECIEIVLMRCVCCSYRYKVSVWGSRLDTHSLISTTNEPSKLASWTAIFSRFLCPQKTLFLILSSQTHSLHFSVPNKKFSTDPVSFRFLKQSIGLWKDNARTHYCDCV